MQVQFSMAVFGPAFGTSSDEGLEALPDIRQLPDWVCLKNPVAQEFKCRLLCLNPTGADPDFFNRDGADGGAKESMKH